VALDGTLSFMLNRNNKALLVRDEAERPHIITQHDILKAMTRRLTRPTFGFALLQKYDGFANGMNV